jgi:tetratricopeptide (TPR) repeat protein
MLILAGCAQHGPFSLRTEAHGYMRDAVQSEGFAALIEAEKSGSLEELGQTAAVEESLALALKAVHTDPYLFDAHIVTIQILAALDRLDECEEHLLYCLELFPDAIPVREEAIFMEFERFRNPERAAFILEEGLRRNPTHPGFHLLHAELLADSGGSRERILEKIDTLVRFRDLDATTWYRIIGLCVFLSEEGERDAVADPLLALAHERPDVLNEAVAWLFATGLAESARAVFLHTCGLPDAPFELKLATARLMVRLEQPEDVAPILAELEETALDEEQAVSLMAVKGHLKWLEGQKEEALALFREALEQDPSNYDALDGIWLLYERTPLVSEEEIQSRLRQAAGEADDPMVKRFLLQKARALQRPAESLK